MNFINEVTIHVEKLQKDLGQRQSQIDNLRGVCQELLEIFVDVLPYGSIEEYLDDPNRHFLVLEALTRLYEQELDPFHGFSTILQSILHEHDTASRLQQPFVDDIYALDVALQERSPRILL